MATVLTMFSLLILGQLFFFGAKAAETWQLDTIYTLTQSNFTSNITGFLEENAWQIKEYPGFYIFLILRGEVDTDNVSVTSSAYLCLLASTSSSSPQSMSDFSFILSIYLYDYHLFDRGAIVWTANHDHPISSSNSTSVHLRTDGNLVLFGDDPKTPIWSSNTANQGVRTMNISQNPISLVLQSSNGSIMWQSADNPTDILTMGQFLQPGGRLTSWKSPTDPSSGAYTLVMELGGLALYSNLPNPEPYWVWSIYGLNDSFSVKHTCMSNALAGFMRPDSVFELRGYGSPLDNASHWPPFCSLQPQNTLLPFEQYGTTISSLLLILRLEYDGRLRGYNMGSVWSNQLDIFNSDSCLLPDYCGPFGVCTSGSQCSCPSNSSYFTPSLNTSHGCSRTNKLDCNESSLETYQLMLPLSGVEYISSSYTPPLLNISTEETCVDMCSQNCSCLAAFWRQGKVACHHVDDSIGSLRGGVNQSDFVAYLKVNAVRQPQQGRSSKITIIVASVVSAVSLLVILVLLFVYYRYKQLKAEENDDEDALMDAMIPGLPSRFTYKELEQITNGFARQLGRGGFGTVYAGLLPNGTQVAVKKLESLRQGNKEFRSEVAIMGGIHHNNLLALLGFCSQKGHRLLVYEFMENGSLDQWLFAEAHKRLLLTWDVRCKIALGTARGLAYLHDDCREKIIHLDIKPQNILLDESFNAKVADFGLSRLVDRNEKNAVMTTMRGTPGYLAPDWVKEGGIDEKCDVYSFGMLLMEIISGRKNFDYTVDSREEAYYPEWAFWQAQQGDLKKLTDTTLDSEEHLVWLRRMIKTAFLCVLESPALRPSMQNVVQMLQGHIPVDEIQLSSLHQGLLFVLKSPSSFAITRIGEALQGLLQRSATASTEATPLLESGGVISTFSISGR